MNFTQGKSLGWNRPLYPDIAPLKLGVFFQCNSLKGKSLVPGDRAVLHEVQTDSEMIGMIGSSEILSSAHGLRSGPLFHMNNTLPKTNIAPENGWLEYYFPLGMAYFQGRAVSFRECTFPSEQS